MSSTSEEEPSVVVTSDLNEAEAVAATTTTTTTATGGDGTIPTATASSSGGGGGGPGGAMGGAANAAAGAANAAAGAASAAAVAAANAAAGASAKLGAHMSQMKDKAQNALKTSVTKSKEAASKTKQVMNQTMQSLSNRADEMKRERQRKHVVRTAPTESEALDALKAMIASAKAEAETKNRRPQKWNFATAPLDAMSSPPSADGNHHHHPPKTVDDMLLAFIRWSKIDEDAVGVDDIEGEDDGNNGTSPTASTEETAEGEQEGETTTTTTTTTTTKSTSTITRELYNLSKAFARLEAYASWMDKTGRDLVDPPLTVESVREACEAWGVKISTSTQSAGTDHIIWWIDVSKIHLDKIKGGSGGGGNSNNSGAGGEEQTQSESSEQPPSSSSKSSQQQQLSSTDSMRFFVWLSHYIMLQPHSQERGMIVVLNMENMNLWQSAAVLPQPLGAKIDRLTMGTLPVKLKRVYLVQSPRWTNVVMKILQPFLSPRMKERVVQLEHPIDLEAALGLDCIPQDFPGCNGTMEKDQLATEYFG